MRTVGQKIRTTYARRLRASTLAEAERLQRRLQAQLAAARSVPLDRLELESLPRVRPET